MDKIFFVEVQERGNDQTHPEKLKFVFHSLKILASHNYKKKHLNKIDFMLNCII